MLVKKKFYYKSFHERLIYQTNHSNNEALCFFIFRFGVKKLWKDRFVVISLSDS